MSRRIQIMLVVLVALAVCGSMAEAQVPPLLNYQGRVALNGTNFHGTGQFKFALGNNTNLSVVYWHNSTSWDSMDWEPVTAVSLPVTRGLFSVLLGDTSLANMAALSPTVFTNSQVWLRTWFDDGVSGAQRLMPDQRIVSAGYAMQAERVKSGAITTEMLSDDAVTGAKIADATITFANIAQGGASAGQALVWNGTAWSNAAPSAGLSGYDENGPFSPAPVAGGDSAIAMGVGANAYGDYSVVGGGRGNAASDRSTVAGGYANRALASDAVVCGGYSNICTVNASCIGGGYANCISTPAYSFGNTICGGWENRMGGLTLEDPLLENTIAGGYGNHLESQARYSTIGGGRSNHMFGGDCGTIAGGSGNVISTSAVGAAIGGGQENMVYERATNAVIAGGEANMIGRNGIHSTIGGGQGNYITGTVYPVHHSTICGGSLNLIWQGPYAYDSAWNVIVAGLGNSAFGRFAFIGGGLSNSIDGAEWSFIGGGQYNQIVGELGSVIAGGIENQIHYSDNAVIAGGIENQIHYSDNAVIAGGNENQIEDICTNAVIAGGWANVISNDSPWSTIGGGYKNYIAPFSRFATIPGGRYNEASNDYTCAMGHRAKARHEGAFVWGDSEYFDVLSTNADSWTVRCVGGARFISGINGSGGVTSGVFLATGAGNWVSLSDRNAKEAYVPVDPRAVLAKVAELPITTWQYKTQDPSIRHIGPVAQDFHAAFGLGETPLGINGTDIDGVALAAIQGLYRENQELKARLEAMEKKLEAMGR